MRIFWSLIILHRILLAKKNYMDNFDLTLKLMRVILRDLSPAHATLLKNI